MKISGNKLVIILSILIAINLLIILGSLLNISKLNKPTQLISHFISEPKIGFGEILAQTMQVPQVLSVTVDPVATSSPIPKETIKLSKNKYRIAVIGDSMVETMGENMDYLQVALKEKYPNTSFELFNYGVGSEKVTSGLSRLSTPFDRNSRHFPALSELKPDILILGSYAYNPFDTHDPLRHYNELAELVSEARSISKVYLLAEIAPIESGFGTGPGGVNWPSDLANAHVAKIEEQMQNPFKIAKELTIPIINIYDASKRPGSNFGKSEYISTHDHIHPSILGQIFTAQIISYNLELR